MFIDQATSIRASSLLLLELLDPLLQALASLPEHRRHPLVVQPHQFPVLEDFELAEALAQRALLRHEARLLGGAVDSIVAPGLHAAKSGWTFVLSLASLRFWNP